MNHYLHFANECRKKDRNTLEKCFICLSDHLGSIKVYKEILARRNKEPIATSIPALQPDPKSQTRSVVSNQMGNSLKTYTETTNRTLLKNDPNFNGSQ